jgi:hypothetical protein
MPTTHNAAYDMLLEDYTRYHVVFVLLGGLATTALAATSIVLWSRYRRVQAARERGFERKLYFRLAILNSLFLAFVALAFAANLSTALRPQPGLDALIAAPHPSGGQPGVVDAWLRAATAKVPRPYRQRSISDSTGKHQEPLSAPSCLLALHSSRFASGALSSADRQPQPTRPPRTRVSSRLASRQRWHRSC